MRQVVILGGGKIGSLIATLLVKSGDYTVSLGDMDPDVVASHSDWPRDNASKRFVEKRCIIPGVSTASLGAEKTTELCSRRDPATAECGRRAP